MARGRGRSGLRRASTKRRASATEIAEPTLTRFAFSCSRHRLVDRVEIVGAIACRLDPDHLVRTEPPVRTSGPRLALPDGHRRLGRIDAEQRGLNGLGPMRSGEHHTTVTSLARVFAYNDPVGTRGGFVIHTSVLSALRGGFGGESMPATLGLRRRLSCAAAVVLTGPATFCRFLR